MLSRTGWTTVLTSVLLLVAASAVGYVELAVLGVAGLLAVGCGLAWVLYRPQLDVIHTVDPVRVTVGDCSTARVTVTNGSSRMSLPTIAIDRVGGYPIQVPIPRLRRGQSTAMTYTVPTGRRAVLVVGPLEITRSDPFGFVRFDQHHGQPETVFVHPHWHELRPLPTSLERSLEGPTSDRAPRGSQVFHALREYVPGDDRRMIHWKTSARTGTLMVRQHIDTTLPDLTIVLDTRRSRHTDESFEQAVEVAASLVVACARQRFPVRLRTTAGEIFEPPTGQEPSTYFLDRLAGVVSADVGDLVGIAQALQSGLAGLALLVVTGRPSREDVRSLVLLTRRYDSVTVIDLHSDPDRRATAPGVVRIEAETSNEFAQIWNRGAW